jgi:23S rRNA pseudouridine2604 synthase
MAELGLCARREADEWIARGWVKANAQVVPTGPQVTADARIKVEPKVRMQ